MTNAFAIEDFIRRTEVIMDRHDPAKRIGMIIDEWGTWFDVEPGTNPGFLYQQNTLRNALVAGLSLNIFNAHAERVHMTNIVQTINVLQAMILTEGPKMLRTPTYHVFEMYKVHQDATLLPSHFECGTYDMTNKKIPQLSVSASRSENGTINLSLCNLYHENDADLNCELRGTSVSSASGRILTSAKMDTLNTFKEPDKLVPNTFGDFKLAKNRLAIKLPAKSVVVLEIRDLKK